MRCKRRFSLLRLARRLIKGLEILPRGLLRRFVELILFPEFICNPKSKGGLGFQFARDLNKAYLIKLAFAFMQNPDPLWVQVLHSKYFRSTASGLRPRNLSSQSALWRGICRVWSIIIEGSGIGIRDGKATMFWTGRWLDSSIRLIDHADRALDIIDVEEPVCNFTSASISWDFQRLRRHLSEDIISQVVGMSPPMVGSGEDSWSWGGESNGIFSIRMAYELITHPQNSRPLVDWEAIWRWTGPNRVRHFLWLASHGKIMTNAERKHRNITPDDSCPRCPGVEEYVLHVLRDCCFAKQVWNSLGFDSSHPLLSGPVLHDWLRAIVTNERSLLLGITCWYLGRLVMS
ncbi:Putative ribonuclease H protein At1g65750 [Linum perenne]